MTPVSIGASAKHTALPTRSHQTLERLLLRNCCQPAGGGEKVQGSLWEEQRRSSMSTATKRYRSCNLWKSADSKLEGLAGIQQHTSGLNGEEAPGWMQLCPSSAQHAAQSLFRML